MEIYNSLNHCCLYIVVYTIEGCAKTGSKIMLLFVDGVRSLRSQLSLIQRSKIKPPLHYHCTMGKLQWRDQIRNFSLLREIMTILRGNVTFTV